MAIDRTVARFMNDLIKGIHDVALQLREIRKELIKMNVKNPLTCSKCGCALDPFYGPSINVFEDQLLCGECYERSDRRLKAYCEQMGMTDYKPQKLECGDCGYWRTVERRTYNEGVE